MVFDLGLWGDQDSIAAHIRRIRKLRNLSQEKLSLLIDASPSYIQQVEGGRTLPNFIYGMRICKALECNPEDLMIEVEVKRKGVR